MAYIPLFLISVLFFSLRFVDIVAHDHHLFRLSLAIWPYRNLEKHMQELKQ